MAKVFKFAEFTNNVLEKLSIQPVTKERMVKKGIVHYNSSDEMKDNFQTGDVVTFGSVIDERSGEYTELQTLMYIAPSDYDYLDWHTGMNFDRKDTQKMGVFVVFLIDENGKTSFDWNNYTFLQDYNSKLDWSGGYVGNILRVYRMLDFKCNRSGNDDGTLLFDEDTFEFQKKRAVVVWSRKVNFVSEKLTIQPVTKNSLKNRNIVSSDDMRNNFQTGDVVTFRGDANRTFLYVAFSDYTSLLAKYTKTYYDGDKNESGVFIGFGDGFANTVYSVAWETYTFLEDYDSNLNWNVPRKVFQSNANRLKDIKSVGICDIMNVYRIPNLKCRDNENNFLIKEFVSIFSKSNANLIWSRGNRYVSEKLTIQPVTKERLAKTDVSRKIYRVGDIVYCTYLGRVYFYEITKRTKSWLWLVRIGEKLTKGSKNSSTYSVQPDSDVVYEDETKRAKIGSDGYASVKIFYQETLYVWKGEDVEGYFDN